MQKRVYGQGWIMTLLKFFVLGHLLQRAAHLASSARYCGALVTTL
jgi:hypothetical protein